MPTNPVYQSTGTLYSDFPKIQPYALQESIKASQSLQNSLDRISEFAFKGAKIEAEKQGLQYGIDHPITSQQIVEATKGGINPNTLLIEGGTTFGDAAHKVQAKLLRADLELDARNEINNIKAAVATGTVLDITEVEGKLQGIIDGYSKMIGKLDPEEGVSARASISTHAIEARKEAGNQIAKIVQIQNIQTVDEAKSTYYDDSLSLLNNMQIKDPTQFAELLKPTKLAIINKAMQTGPENFKKVIDDIAKIDKKVINTAIANNIATQTDFTKAVLDLDKGIAGDYTAMFKMEDKDEIIKMATEAASSKHNLIKQTQDLQRTVNEESYRDITTRFANGVISGDQAIKELTLKNIHISDDEYKAIKYGQDDTPGNMKQFESMYNRAQTDSLSIAEIDKAANAKLITYKQAFKLKETYFGRTDDDKTASKVIMNGVGVASGETLIRQPDKIVFVAQANKLFAQRRDAARLKGEPFNVSVEARNAIAEVVGSSKTPEYEEAQKDLESFSKSWGFKYDEDAYTEQDVDKLWKDKPQPERKVLKQALRHIKKYKDSQKAAAGIRD